MAGWENVIALAGTAEDHTGWEKFLTDNPKVLWGLVADVVKAAKASEGERRTGRRPAVAVGSLDELYAVLFPKRFDSTPFPHALHLALGERSQRAFAQEVGFNQATVSRLLSGKTPPTVETMERIAYILKLSPTYFAEYRAMKLGQLVTDVLLAHPHLSIETLRTMARSGA